MVSATGLSLYATRVFDFFFLNNFIYKMITYTTYSINYTYIVGFLTLYKRWET